MIITLLTDCDRGKRGDALELRDDEGILLVHDFVAALGSLDADGLHDVDRALDGGVSGWVRGLREAPTRGAGLLTPRARERLEDLVSHCEQQAASTWSTAARDAYQYCGDEVRAALADCDTIPAAPPSVVPMREPRS